MEQINEITFKSKKNMTFVHINEPNVNLGNIIQIGLIPGTKNMDDIKNYKEVEKTVFEQGENDAEKAFIKEFQS